MSIWNFRDLGIIDSVNKLGLKHIFDLTHILIHNLLSLLIDQNVQKQECSQKVLKEVIGNLRKSIFCRTEAVCNSIKYSASWQEFEITNAREKSGLVIAYEDYEVEYHDTTINYGLQSLISEIGGLLGLTLGASIISMFDSVKFIGHKFLLLIKNRIKQ